MNVDASEMTVDTTQLQHALNHHGVGRETNPNQVAITSEDLIICISQIRGKIFLVISFHQVLDGASEGAGK